MSRIGALSMLARSRHGVFTVVQATELGVDASALRRLRATGIVERRAPRVYAMTGAPRTAMQELAVHVFTAGHGALATGDSGLALWCPEVAPPERPEVAVHASRRYRTTAATVRRSSDLELAKPNVLGGIPVVGVARALLDASIDRSVEEVLSRIDACRRHRPISIGALVEVLETHGRRGRPGIATFRRAVASLGRQVPDSDFERLVLRDLRRAGVSPPCLHHVVRPAGEGPIELDLGWPDHLLDVELDGRDHVARSRTARRDRQRDRLLQALGYRVLRYTWSDYVGDPVR